MDRTVILNEEVNIACDVAGKSRNASDKAPFAQKMQKTMRHLPTQARSATVWMAAMLALTWMPETQASPDQAPHLADAQHATSVRNLYSGRTASDGKVGCRSSNDKSIRVAQAVTSDDAPPQQSPEQEHQGVEALSCELTIARRDIEFLQHLEQEHDRAERLEQDLAAARRDVETQAALTAKAVEETARMKQAAQSGAAELQKSLQPERERFVRLEQDRATTWVFGAWGTAVTAAASTVVMKVWMAAYIYAVEGIDLTATTIARDLS